MSNLKTLCLLSTAFALTSLSIPAAAHHGSNGQFDQSKTMTVSGVVTNIRFVNPHSYVYFDVTNDKGEIEPWRCELRSSSVHRRFGWTKDMFKEGREITIEGAPAWREPHGCFTRTITFEDGVVIARNARIGEDGEAIPQERSLKLSSGKPNISGTWVAPPRGPRPAPTRNPNVPEPQANMGAPEPALPPAGDDLTYGLTEAGYRALDGVTDQDNPRFQCKTVNIIQDWIFDQHVNKIDQYGDVIIMQYGLMDLSRTIHMNVKKLPKDIEPSRAGYSIGNWKDGVLHVETTNFAPGFLLTGGAGMVKNSDQLRIVERMSMSEDGSTITREYEATDPLFLTGIYKGSDKNQFTAAPFERYGCDDLTEEVVSGF